MELRHLRYFIVVAEAGSMKLAAESRLHTAQPSLSRQMRDLEHEVGVAVFARSVRRVELTVARSAFPDHARLAMTQAEAAAEAACRAARPAKAIFAVGFLTGQEAAWLAPTTRVLNDELLNIGSGCRAAFRRRSPRTSTREGSTSPFCAANRTPTLPLSWF
jgi:LysR family transcriptional regulator, hca operon transcriptional activator